MTKWNDRVENACLDGVDFWHANAESMLLDDLVRGVQEIAFNEAKAHMDDAYHRGMIAGRVDGRTQALSEAITSVRNLQKHYQKADRPCFKRAPLPSYAEIRRMTANHTEPAPTPDQRWSWWAVQHWDGKHGPKIVVCLHVMEGRREFEARYDIPMTYYHEKKVMVTRAPVTDHDHREVRMGIWDAIADKMETWPELRRVIDDLTHYVRETHGIQKAEG